MAAKKPLKVEVSGTSAASPETIWSLIEDATLYHQWGPWTDSGYDRPGDDSPHGPGAIRRLRYGRTITIERVVDVQPCRRFTYTVVSGIPVRNYAAVVELTPGPSGTTIHWSATFDRTLVGRVVRRKLQQIYDLFMQQLLVAVAEVQAAKPR